MPISRPHPFALWIILATILFSLGLYAGYRLFAPGVGQNKRISAEAILTTLRDRGFLVSQTYLFDTPITIQESTGSALKDFFFGKTLEARASVEVNLGIDLAELSADDITVDRDAQTITIRLPEARIFNSRVVGPIEVKNTRGILKLIIDRDPGYNEALKALTESAETAASSPSTLIQANEHARDEVERIVSYISPDATVIFEE